MEQNKKQILTYKSLESVTAQVLVHAVNGLGWTDFLHDLVELINNDSSLNNLSEQFDKNNSTFLFPNKKNSEDKTVKNFILINFFKGIGNMGLQSVDATFLPFINAAFISTPLKTTGGYAIAAWSEEFQKQKEVQKNINEKLDYNTKSKIVVAPLTKLLLPLVAFRNTEKRLGKKKYKTEEEKNILSRSRAMIKDYLIGLHVISFGIDVIESAEFSNFLKNAFSTLASDGLETFNNLGLIEGEVLVNYCDSPKNLLLRENMISQKDIDDLESLLIQPFVQANLFYNNVIRGKFKNDNFDLWQLIKEIEFEYTQEFSLNPKASLSDYFVLASEFVFNYIWVCFIVTENTLINLIKS